MKHLYSIIGTNSNLEDTLIAETFNKEEAERIFQEAVKDFIIGEYKSNPYRNV